MGKKKHSHRGINPVVNSKEKKKREKKKRGTRVPKEVNTPEDSGVAASK